jgi:uncharacterized protein (DUF433 family)
MREITQRIVIDPQVRFGKPTIKGTRITVEEVLGFLAGGMGFDEIEQEYGLAKSDVRAAVDYAASFSSAVYSNAD